MVQVFLAVHTVPAAPIMVDIFSFVFLPNLVCASEVTNDVHQGVSASTSFMFSPGCISLHVACPFFFPFGFVSCTSVLRMISFAIRFLI